MTDDPFKLPRGMVEPLRFEPPRFDMSPIFEAQEAMARTVRERTAREIKVAEAAEHAMNAAAIAVECLFEEIAAFEESLSDHQEVALFVIGGPAGQTFFPQVLKALNPDKVLFGGADQDGRPFTVVQHVSQLNFAMMATVVAENVEPRRVGFHFPEE